MRRKSVVRRKRVRIAPTWSKTIYFGELLENIYEFEYLDDEKREKLKSSLEKKLSKLMGKKVKINPIEMPRGRYDWEIIVDGKKVATFIDLGNAILGLLALKRGRTVYEYGDFLNPYIRSRMRNGEKWYRELKQKIATL